MLLSASAPLETAPAVVEIGPVRLLALVKLHHRPVAVQAATSG